MQAGLLLSAFRLINRHGVNAMYSVVTESSFNIETQRRTAIAVDVVVKAYRPIYSVKPSESLSTINKTESVILISGLEIEAKNILPKKGDYITYEGERVQIDKIMKHWANGKVSLYRFFLTKV